MNKNPLKIIDQYLERVKVYLPLHSEETLMEIRTHLIEEAENIGDGKMTEGSALMAVERLGDPKNVANEYAGTGAKKGPIPKEYFMPVMRLVVGFVGIIITFAVGAYIVGIFNPSLFSPIPLTTLLVTIGVNVVIIIVIFGIITIFESKSVAEKTMVEEVLSLGVAGFKPKPRSDALGEAVFGVIFAVILLLPQTYLLYSDPFRMLVGIIAVLTFVGAIKGALFFYAGENNLNLVLEAVLSALSIVVAMALINIGWPLDYVWGFSGNEWQLISMAYIESLMDLPITPFDAIWYFIIFIVVLSNTWKIISAAVKVPVYLQEDRGLWWRGRWGQRKKMSDRRLKLRRESQEESRTYVSGSDSVGEN
ncbi:hypothetical protein EU538_08555 [Candidatus Thorarchaeota archaeon]|jgi:uncharacterized membrane protein|nr:MAG: hypothetical protein EU538_08555 [Candidatus Thorarchaeota archaeon]